MNLLLYDYLFVRTLDYFVETIEYSLIEECE